MKHRDKQETELIVLKCGRVQLDLYSLPSMHCYRNNKMSDTEKLQL